MKIIDLANADLATVATASASDLVFLDRVVAREVYPYFRASIPKRTGGERILEIPWNELMPVQSWVLANVLEHGKPHAASFAFTKGRSVRLCAEQHLGARWLLKMDLKSFFPSIDERSVYYLMLKEFGAGKLLAFQLARLLTGATETTDGERAVRKYQDPYVSQYRSRYVAGYKAQCLGHLPQGSPSSGAIANLVARGLDVHMASLARLEGLTYSRYADDLFLSSYHLRDRKRSARLIGQVSDIVSKSGFEVNEAKTRISGPGTPLRVLGLHVDGPALRLPKEVRHKIDRHLRGIREFGLVSHADHVGHSDARFLLSEVEGLLGYANDVARGWSRPRVEEFARILVSNGVQRGPFNAAAPESERFTRARPRADR